MNALLDLGDVDNWVKFLQDKLIGKTASSSNVVINEEIKSLDVKINEDIDQLRVVGAIDEFGCEFEFFNIINLGDMDSAPLWDSEKLEEVDISELERGVRDIDRISHLVKDYEDYKNHLWNKKLEAAMVNGVEDCLLSRDYVKDKKINGPIGLAMDVYGNLYVANYGNDNILKVNKRGEVSILLGNVKKPYGLYLKGNMLFVSSQGSNSVIRYKLKN